MNIYSEIATERRQITFGKEKAITESSPVTPHFAIYPIKQKCT